MIENSSVKKSKGGDVVNQDFAEIKQEKNKTADNPLSINIMERNEVNIL